MTRYDGDPFSDFGPNPFDTDYRTLSESRDMFESEWSVWLEEPIYPVIVNDLLSMNPEWIRKFGIPSTNNHDLDRSAASRSAIVSINLNTMIAYKQDGLSINVPLEHRDNIREMHKALTGYLMDWCYEIENNPSAWVGEYTGYLKAMNELNADLYRAMLAHDHDVDINIAKANLGLQITDMGGYMTEQRERDRPTYEIKYGEISRMLRERSELERSD